MLTVQENMLEYLISSIEGPVSSYLDGIAGVTGENKGVQTNDCVVLLN